MGMGTGKYGTFCHLTRLHLGTAHHVHIAGISREAIVSDGTFAVPNGQMAFAPGSSGWRTRRAGTVRWMEVFLRGGTPGKPSDVPRLELRYESTNSQLLGGKLPEERQVASGRERQGGQYGGSWRGVARGVGVEVFRAGTTRAGVAGTASKAADRDPL